MTFIDDEISQDDAEPIELYKFSAPNKDYFLTSNVEDVTFGVDTYSAVPLKRNALKGASQEDSPILEIRLPITEEVVSENAFEIAPRSLSLELTRLHTPSGQSAVYWIGDITSITIDGSEAILRIPSKFGSALAQPVPSVYFQTQCNHVLYSDRCKVLRNSFRLQTTVNTANQTAIILATIDGNPDEFFKGGEIVRTSDGERRLIVQQIGTLLTLNFPFKDMDVGDSVEVFAGCDRTVETCKAKFSNVVNFGGHPLIPPINVFNEGLK